MRYDPAFSRLGDFVKHGVRMDRTTAAFARIKTEDPPECFLNCDIPMLLRIACETVFQSTYT